jgi:hypothetical protein
LYTTAWKPATRPERGRDWRERSATGALTKPQRYPWKVSGGI